MLAISLFAWSGVNAAVTITADGENGVIVKADNAGEFQSYTPTAEELALLRSRSTLKLQGNFNGNDLMKFRDHQAVSATTVDFCDATFEKNSSNDISSQTFQYWQDGKNFVMSKTEMIYGITVQKNSNIITADLCFPRYMR